MTENHSKRNPPIFSETDLIIADCVAKMEKYISLCERPDEPVSVFDEKSFDHSYTKLVALLDENGWQ